MRPYRIKNKGRKIREREASSGIQSAFEAIAEGKEKQRVNAALAEAADRAQVTKQDIVSEYRELFLRSITQVSESRFVLFNGLLDIKAHDDRIHVSSPDCRLIEEDFFGRPFLEMFYKEDIVEVKNRYNFVRAEDTIAMFVLEKMAVGMRRSLEGFREIMSYIEKEAPKTNQVLPESIL